MIKPKEVLADNNLQLKAGFENLRASQIHAYEWVQAHPEPYLLINAPTGSGKTLMLALLGCTMADEWTYAVQTIRLQEQVADTFPGIPVLTGRRNHPCLIGMETHGMAIMADDAICSFGEDCDYKGAVIGTNELGREMRNPMCGYYQQRYDALEVSKHRVINYAMMLADFRSVVNSGKTPVLLADEGHNIERAVIDSFTVEIFAPVYRKYGLFLPKKRDSESMKEWARVSGRKISGNARKNPALARIRRDLATLARIEPSNWVVWQPNSNSVIAAPAMGAPIIHSALFNRTANPKPLEEEPRVGIDRAVITSATLMGPEFVADSLGLAPGTWAYLDLESTFPVENRPVYFAPVVSMNKEVMSTKAGRAKMQAAIDQLISHYLQTGRGAGLIHSVSNRYRDQLLTKSKFRGIMTMEVDEHTAAVSRGEASVLVSANTLEGWDGIDDLCKFVLIPKVPYPNLGDPLVRARKEADPRTYDHAALVAVVQGAGRGIRHRNDRAETWILDSAWDHIYRRRKASLPGSFREAYHHKVQLV